MASKYMEYCEWIKWTTFITFRVHFLFSGALQLNHHPLGNWQIFFFLCFNEGCFFFPVNFLYLPFNKHISLCAWNECLKAWLCGLAPFQFLIIQQSVLEEHPWSFTMSLWLCLALAPPTLAQRERELRKSCWRYCAEYSGWTEFGLQVGHSTPPNILQCSHLGCHRLLTEHANTTYWVISA